MRIVVVGLCVAAAVGCAATLERNMNSGLQRFVGKDVHEAIRVLGYPAADQVIAGDHVYRWSTSAGATALTTAAGGVGLTQVNAEGCTIDLVVDPANVVTRYSWTGTRRSCDRYDDLMDAAASK